MLFSLKLLVTLLELVHGSYELLKTDKSASVKLYELIKQYHEYKIHSYYQMRQNWLTSNLGSFLFKYNDQQNRKRRDKTFLIYFWRYGREMKFGLGRNMFDNCSVNNCKVTKESRDIGKADAVIIHVQHGLLPIIPVRHPGQRWVFFTLESPVHLFAMACTKPTFSEWANVFNWTMTYRSDSDVPVPYGRTIPLRTPLSPKEMAEPITNRIPNWKLKQRDVYVTALISHCVAKRLNYVKELQKYINVDLYGRCASDKKMKRVCPGNAHRDCQIINKYIFYLAFENSNCRQYITEKTIYNAYSKGAIPIIMGAPKADCDKLLPPLSFLHVENFSTAKELAEQIETIAMNEEKLFKFHMWRRYFEVANEHGFFGTHSSFICRLCEALNYNDETPKIYDESDLELFFKAELLCDRPHANYSHCQCDNLYTCANTQ